MIVYLLVWRAEAKLPGCNRNLEIFVDCENIYDAVLIASRYWGISPNEFVTFERVTKIFEYDEEMKLWGKVVLMENGEQISHEKIREYINS